MDRKIMKGKRSTNKSTYKGRTHNQIFSELEDEYLAIRETNKLKANILLGKMYETAKEAAGNYIRKYCGKKGLKLEIDILSHDSAIYMIEQYLKKPHFKVEKLSSYIYFGCIKNLFKDREREQLEVSYEELFDEKEGE
jgi:hypothetical protein